MNDFQILIVDDDEKILYAFREVLEKDGFIYQEARDGVEALQMLKEQTPDVIFMDINMPRIDGLEALKKIKEFDYGIPVIVVLREGGDREGSQACERERKRLRDYYLGKGLGVYPTTERALKSLGRMIHYYQNKETRGTS